jgi:Flp pilus assembly protein TadD
MAKSQRWMDQLSAHLERGWDLAQRGDTRGANSSARRALELEPESPEVHNLIGFVAALDGDCDEAIDAYQQAIDLDDNYVEAMLNAAELMVHPAGRFDDAIHLLDQVLDITEFVDEIVDALLLMFEAFVAKGRIDDAKKVLARLPEGPFATATHNFLTGRAHFEIGDYASSQVFVSAAIEQDPHNAEAFYYLGLLAEERGDSRGACAAFLRTRQLELEMGLPPWAPNGETFLLFTDKAIGQLSEELRGFMSVCELYVADLPGPEVVVDGIDPRTMVLVDAMLLGPEDEEAALEVVPEQVTIRIFLYAINLMRGATGLHAVQQTIHEALEAELSATIAELRDDLADEMGELELSEEDEDDNDEDDDVDSLSRLQLSEASDDESTDVNTQNAKSPPD